MLNTYVDNLRRSGTLVENKTGVSHFKRTLRTPGALFLIWAPLVLFLVWMIIIKSVAAYLADTRPERALVLQSTNPTALLNRAETKLKREQAKLNNDQAKLDSSAPSNIDPQAAIKIRSWAELALRNDPLNARAFRILAQLSQHHADEKGTEAFMQAAARRSRHQSAAVYLMMRKSYRDQNYPAAIAYADTLLRTRNDTMQHVAPMLAKIAEIPGASNELKQILADNPPWRPLFFESLPRAISDARTPLELFLALKKTTSPVTGGELRSYLKFLIGRKFYNLAYYAWLEFLPTEQLNTLGRLFNGNFEVSPTGAPFEWWFSGSPGATIEVAPRFDKDEGHALFIKLGPGRVDFGGVAQLILLPPGTYEFQGKQQVDLISRVGFRWHITCAEAPSNRIGESPIVKGRDLEWKDFAFSFTVPEADCSAQYVRLSSEARSESEQFISGSLWFDDLHIELTQRNNL